MQYLEHEPGELEFEPASDRQPLHLLRCSICVHDDLSSLSAWLLHSVLTAVADTVVGDAVQYRVTVLQVTEMNHGVHG